MKVFFRKFLSLKVAPPQSEGEQELMLPDVCSESWLTSQTKDGQLSEFISGRLSLSPCLVVCLKELLTSTHEPHTVGVYKAQRRPWSWPVGGKASSRLASPRRHPVVFV